ncbi:MAG: dihydropteroate synthase [Bacteroidales bacterium]|jgi:dihydropteroate synthase|nr:dihydropteroate synthase [Bacteroidales bacterium]
MTQIMAVVNLTPDSFFEPSRVRATQARERIRELLSAGADIIDLGAVSTRPGAAPVSLREEWRRLAPVVRVWDGGVRLSVDTTRAEIVRRVYDCVGPFIVNDISAGEDDPDMLATAGRLGLPYVAMHKRGNPRTMDAQCDYPGGVIPELVAYFEDFSHRAEAAGIGAWILDPGLGFAKTAEQNWEILEGLDALRVFRRPVLIGAADKRFTGGDTERAHRLALRHGADILRVHDVAAARRTVLSYE